MAKAPTSDKITIINARLSFAQLAKPKAFSEGQDPKFKSTFLLDPSDKVHASIILQIKTAAAKLLAEGGLTKEDITRPPCFGDGNKKKYDGYKDRFYISANQETRPLIVNSKRAIVQEGEPEFPYSGCFVHGTVTLWLQNNKWGKGINANLRSVVFAKDGEAFGAGGVNPDDEFEALGDSPAAAAAVDPFDL